MEDIPVDLDSVLAPANQIDPVLPASQPRHAFPDPAADPDAEGEPGLDGLALDVDDDVLSAVVAALVQPRVAAQEALQAQSQPHPPEPDGPPEPAGAGFAPPRPRPSRVSPVKAPPPVSRADSASPSASPASSSSSSAHHPSLPAAAPADPLPTVSSSRPSRSRPPLPTTAPIPSTKAKGGKGQRVRWTPQEDARLIELVKEEPPLTWTQIGERMGRAGAGCAMRWYNFVRKGVGEAEAVALEARKSTQSQEPTSDADAEGEADSVSNPDATLSRNDERSDSVPPQPMQPNPVDDLADAPPPPTSLQPPSRSLPRARKVISHVSTGRIVELPHVPIDQLPAKLPPAEGKAGHPFPRSGSVHSNSGPHYLPDQALVPNPPIPFQKHTIIRGRRTHDAASLEAAIQSGAAGKTKKVHTCPAENCGAAFKRSEHLKRHYKSVHRGEKPFPCNVADCGKSFSRKDNLQQHQAMVHGVRAMYTYPDGTISPNPPDADEPVQIAYEAVDVSKTARGAAGRTARAKQAPEPSATGRPAPASASGSASGSGSGTGNGSDERLARLPSNVKGLLSASEAATASIGTHAQTAAAASEGASASVEPEPSVGEKRPHAAEGDEEQSKAGRGSGDRKGMGRARRETNGEQAHARGHGRSNKRVRLEVRAAQEDLDPALRALASSPSSTSHAARSELRAITTGALPPLPAAACLYQHDIPVVPTSAAHFPSGTTSAAPVDSGRAPDERGPPPPTLDLAAALSARPHDDDDDEEQDDIELPFSQLHVPGLEAYLTSQAAAAAHAAAAVAVGQHDGLGIDEEGPEEVAGDGTRAGTGAEAGAGAGAGAKEGGGRDGEEVLDEEEEEEVDAGAEVEVQRALDED
ncbi:hypothetical protein JCM1841_006468 [Sporobolomyces salmonicolor]